LENVPLVYCGYKQKEEFGVEGDVIYYGIDTEEFKGYEGSFNNILTVVTDYRSRDQVTGYSLYQRLIEGLPAHNYGRQDDGAISLISRDYEHLKSLYRNYAVFLDTALHSPLSMSMLEAMATGMPVVTHPHDDMPLIIENDVNGIISGNEEYLKEKLRELLSDRKYRQRLGDAARETIKARFSIEQFKKSWTELIERTVKHGNN
jgi:glycosyltransferase involved in cell wall biosynthesis